MSYTIIILYNILTSSKFYNLYIYLSYKFHVSHIKSDLYCVIKKALLIIYYICLLIRSNISYVYSVKIILKNSKQCKNIWNYFYLYIPVGIHSLNLDHFLLWNTLHLYIPFHLRHKWLCPRVFQLKYWIRIK